MLMVLLRETEGLQRRRIATSSPHIQGNDKGIEHNVGQLCQEGRVGEFSQNMENTLVQQTIESLNTPSSISM